VGKKGILERGGPAGLSKRENAGTPQERKKWETLGAQIVPGMGGGAKSLERNPEGNYTNGSTRVP